MSGVPFEVRLFGALDVVRDGQRQNLPRSRKTRALLAYLVATGREHTRERLCTLFWETNDDPRGALRWSLSKLRRVVDEDGLARIRADRQRVGFEPDRCRVDLTDLQRVDTSGASIELLEELASRTRGELLEGLDLPDLFDFQAWCVGVRERARSLRSHLLVELVSRLRTEPVRALGYARERLRVDAFDLAARQDLLEMLSRAGKREEAQDQMELSRRFYREMDPSRLPDLERFWRSLAPVVVSETPSRVVAPTETVVVPTPPAKGIPFVGREVELDRVDALLERVEGSGLRVLLVRGEPGAGKSRFAEVVAGRARTKGLAVLFGRSFEAESSHPFRPWVDALGGTLTGLGQLAGDGPLSRNALFAAVARRLVDRPESGALLVLDDVQWLDPDSAELLHFALRSSRESSVLVLLLARSGEIEDNELASRVLRSLEKELAFDTLDLQALGPEAIERLVAAFPDADPDRIHRSCAGNPLYALELARIAGELEVPGTSNSLQRLVQDRVERLPHPGAEVLRWAAVLGHTVDVERLEALSALDLAALADALERAEQRSLLATEGASYRFEHDVVREAIYASVPDPLRRLMHRRVAKLLEGSLEHPGIAQEVAHHARLAGDAELGIRACLAAGNQSLRVFANGDAETLARRGLELARELPDAPQVEATLELLHLRYSARTPDREEAAERVRDLALRALDLGLTRAARLGFQMLSFLRWESSDLADAHANILQAERVSRSADPGERAAALGQAARCLVLLERNLGQAEAFVMEADALGAPRSAPSAVRFASAMIHLHRGELDDAVAAFREARWLGRESGDRLAEFRALEHWTMLELERGDLAEAAMLAKHLETLGGKVREGAERWSARALGALVDLLRQGEGGDGSVADLEAALERLRLADAKYPLAFARLQLARYALERGKREDARREATRGLEMATAIGRVSDVAQARLILAQVEQNPAARDEHVDALDRLEKAELSARVRRELEARTKPT